MITPPKYMLGSHPHVAGGFSDDCGSRGPDSRQVAAPMRVQVNGTDYPVTDIELKRPDPAADTFPAVRTCRKCGCTDRNCRQCIERTGEPCHWVEADLCSACVEVPALFSEGEAVKVETSENIRQLWGEIEDEFPDKSTPFLMQMVCDRGRLMYRWDIDHGDVAEALAVKT